VYVTKTIVTRDITRQHPRVGGIHIGADECEAHPGLGSHGEHAQHPNMAMATTDQNKVA